MTLGDKKGHTGRGWGMELEIVILMTSSIDGPIGALQILRKQFGGRGWLAVDDAPYKFRKSSTSLMTGGGGGVKSGGGG